MKKIITFIFMILIISSCSKQELILNENKETEVTKNEKYFTIIPHHNLVDEKIDEYYNYLKNKYNNFDNIIIISPNHFENVYYSPWVETKFCNKMYPNECLTINSLDWINLDKNIISNENIDELVLTKEHWIANHFKFINKYFKNSDIYSILLKIDIEKDYSLEEISEKLKNYNFKWKTLFIWSVDFSHHVNEKVAVFHDMNTLDYLNGWFEKKIEVDCPNCLYLIKDLSSHYSKNNFDLYSRTSTDSFLNINSNFDNTSHIYWEFIKEKKDNYDSVFSWLLDVSNFDINTWTWNINNNYVYWMFFWDTHFTRWFTSYYNKNTIDDYLSCFYSNADLTREIDYWHNRIFYWFDIVWVNLETSVWYKDECQYSQKEIKFQTDPKYLLDFKKVWINTFNLANNHSYDCWNIWYEATKKYLEQNNLDYFWDWRKDEQKVLKKDINWTKVAFVWFNDIWNQINISDKSDKIKTLTDEWYIVIVNIHWWMEYHLKSNNRQKNIAKSFIDSWAKLIIWHHPHVVQDYEIYKWVPIFYSLWNFIFDQPFENTLKWYWLVFAINNNSVKYNLLEFNRNSKNFMIDCNSFK